MGAIAARAVVLAIAVIVAPLSSAAQQTAAPASAPAAAPAVTSDDAVKPAGRTRATLTWLAGGAAGLLIHEAGHVGMAAALGAAPRVKGIEAGRIPFFAIAHDAGGRRGEYAVSAAGLWSQHAGVEWILTRRPHLKDEHAPFLKGIFAFHLATSTMYGIAGLGGLGPPERDTRGMAISIGRSGMPESGIGALVLAPAALDAYRYFRPGSRWATWASRGAKLAAVVLVVAAGSD
jgi:hypothetical protein